MFGTEGAKSSPNKRLFNVIWLWIKWCSPLAFLFSSDITLSLKVSDCPCKWHMYLFRENLYRDKSFLSNEVCVSCVFFDLVSKLQKVEQSIDTLLRDRDIAFWNEQGKKKKSSQMNSCIEINHRPICWGKTISAHYGERRWKKKYT